MSKLVAIDAGKFATKVITGNYENKVYFRTSCIEMDSPILSFDGKTYLIEFEGKSYLIGEGVNSFDFNVSKSKISHKLAILLGCALLDVSEVNLVTGFPLSLYLNNEFRIAHIEYLRGNYGFKVNGKEKNININTIHVVPETMGVVVTNAENYIESLVGVIDVGGLNTNACLYDKLRPIKSSGFTINEGGVMLFAKIKRALNMKFGLNYQDYEIPHVIRKDDLKVNSIINDVINNHLANIFNECQRYNWNLSEIELIFTGGGSLLLDASKIKISKSAIWDNCYGFFRWGLIQCRNQ